MKLFVRNLPYDLEEDVLSKLFEKLGRVVSARIVKDKYTGRSKGFGFVEMSSDDEGKAAIEQLNGESVQGRSIVVDKARDASEGGERREYRGGGESRGGDSRGGDSRGGDRRPSRFGGRESHDRDFRRG